MQAVDEQVVGEAVSRIARVAIALYGRGRGDDREIARAIGDQVKRIQTQLQRMPDLGSDCKRCGEPVPEVTFGRPRYYCESCHPPRYKVADKVPAKASIEP